MSMLHPMFFLWRLFSYSFAQGKIFLLYQLQACQRETHSPFPPAIPFHLQFPLPQEGMGRTGFCTVHLCARRFTSLTRILHCFLLKMGSVLQAGGDSRSACLKLSSDSSVCNWYDVVQYFFFKLQTALCAEVLKGWFLFWLLSCWLAKHKVCVTFWG